MGFCGTGYSSVAEHSFNVLEALGLILSIVNRTPNQREFAEKTQVYLLQVFGRDLRGVMGGYSRQLDQM